VKRSIAAFVLLLLGTIALAQSPNDVIQTAADSLADGLSGHKEELSHDKAKLHALVDRVLLPRFDRRYAAQLVLGKHWRTATAKQRDGFVHALYGSLLRRYSDGVLEFDQGNVEILPFRGDESKKRTTVKTIVRLEDGTKVPVNYGMVRRDSGWLMFDVTIEGISYVRNFRTEMNSEIQAKGLDAVIVRLENERAGE
jgi:phospholipid transport system substrate-binding protein